MHDELHDRNANPDGKRLIPFDTCNMFYRDDLEETRLRPLRDSALASLGKIVFEGL
jgi:hypothetical protein